MIPLWHVMLWWHHLPRWHHEPPWHRMPPIKMMMMILKKIIIKGPKKQKPAVILWKTTVARLRRERDRSLPASVLRWCALHMKRQRGTAGRKGHFGPGGRRPSNSRQNQQL